MEDLENVVSLLGTWTTPVVSLIALVAFVGRPAGPNLKRAFLVLSGLAVAVALIRTANPILGGVGLLGLGALGAMVVGDFFGRQTPISLPTPQAAMPSQASRGPRAVAALRRVTLAHKGGGRVTARATMDVLVLHGDVEPSPSVLVLRSPEDVPAAESRIICELDLAPIYGTLADEGVGTSMIFEGEIDLNNHEQRMALLRSMLAIERLPPPAGGALHPSQLLPRSARTARVRVGLPDRDEPHRKHRKSGVRLLLNQRNGTEWVQDVAIEGWANHDYDHLCKVG